MKTSSRKLWFQKNLKVSGKTGKKLMALAIFLGMTVVVGLSIFMKAEVEGISVPLCHCPVPNCDPLPAQANPLPRWLLQGSQSGAQPGSPLAGGKDLDCNGFSDVVVGAPYYTSPVPDDQYNGSVVVLYGSAAGLSYTPGRYWEYVGPTKSRFGNSCAVGDVNGDEKDDLIVGAYYYRTESDSAHVGRVYVFFGSTSGLGQSPDVIIEGEQGQLHAELGCAVAYVGDVNGDSRGEILVGAHRYINYDDPNLPVYYVGKVYLYRIDECHNPQLIWSYEGTVEGTYLGDSVASAGDVNGDGKTDIIIGAPMAGDGTGKVIVFYHTGDVNNPYGQSPSWYTNGENHTQFGISVASAGKVKGTTGCDAIIVGARYWKVGGVGGFGKASIYYGAPGGLGTDKRAPDAAIYGESSDDNLGTSVGLAGDINKDSYADIFVGAPGNGTYNRGRVAIYFGSANGIILQNPCTISGPTNNAKLGNTACYAGDINGDCAEDIVSGGTLSPGLIQVNYGWWGTGGTGCYYLPMK